MKKYYATEVDGEFYDYRAYIQEDMFAEDMAIYGNREFVGINVGLVKDIIKALEDCKYDIDTVRDDLEDGEINKDEFEDEIIKVVDGYFNKDLAREQKLELVKLCDEYSKASSRISEGEVLLKAMSINYEKQYHVRQICGYCQGDYNDLYYPEGKSEEYLNYLEAAYFATGTEFEITEEAVEENELDEADTYFDYTYLYRPAEIKTWLAKNIGCTEDEIVVRTIKKRHTHYSYEYEKN